MRERLLVTLVVGAGSLLGACGGGSGETTTGDAGAPTSTSAPEYASELLQACEPGAQEWDGVPIAAFEDPSNDGLVVCWADGHVPKSPPPGDDATIQPSFDRVVYTATMDGQLVEMLQAGYRDRMAVQPP